MPGTQPDSAPHKLARNLITAPAVAAEETASVRKVARLMLEHGVGAVPILAASAEAVGIASDGDLLGQNETVGPGGSACSRRVRGPTRLS